MTENETVYFFNPQNDLCLANGRSNFTAPLSSLRLAQAGASLPMWYAKPGSCFWGAVNAGWFNGIRQNFDIDVKPTIQAGVNAIANPWGWSMALLRQLEELGFNKDLLPDNDKIEKWRLLSSRLTNIDLIGKILGNLPGTSPTLVPRICKTAEQVYHAIGQFGVSIIKLPWSGSGRGQQITDRTTPVELKRRIDGMIHRQGGVEVAPFYNKILDFAMLWESNRFIGYSLFETDSHGGWTSNVLLTDEQIKNVINKHLSVPIDFDELQQGITNLVADFASDYQYTGPVGIDFIVAGQNNANILVPIEVNWRMTMGRVAHSLRENFMSQNTFGRFWIVETDKYKEPFHDVSQCEIAEGRVVAGKLDLVPPGGAFRFVMNVENRT